jgi:hypothetical protein
MSKKSLASRVVRKTASEIPAASAANLTRLRAAMQGPIDTSDIAERRKFERLRRDSAGRLPPRKSPIRDAIVREMKQRELTAYRLWQMARAHYPALSQSAVHEFLKGQRQLELPSAEALLAAVELQIVKEPASGNGGHHGKRKLNGKVRVR